MTLDSGANWCLYVCGDVFLVFARVCALRQGDSSLKVEIPPKTVGDGAEDWSPEVVKIDRDMPKTTGKEYDRPQTPLRPRPSSTGKVRNMGDAGPSGAEKLLGNTVGLDCGDY